MIESLNIQKVLLQNKDSKTTSINKYKIDHTTINVYDFT
jgi:hypothetical protein